MSAAGDRPAAARRDPERSRRRPYRRPALDRLGDLRGLTLGASPGIPDSGIGTSEQAQP